MRDFWDDGSSVVAEHRRTVLQKVVDLELMLGQITNFYYVIVRNTIIKGSTSLKTIWQATCFHFGVQSTGAHVLDFANSKLKADEKPKDLCQRLMAFVDGHLLYSSTEITHHGAAITEEEEIILTLENFVVLTWLQLIDADLPKLVKQQYGTKLRSHSLAGIKSENSQALDSLLEEIRSSEGRKMRTTIFPPKHQAKEGYRPKPVHQAIPTA